MIENIGRGIAAALFIVIVAVPLLTLCIIIDLINDLYWAVKRGLS